MDELTGRLDEIDSSIRELEIQIADARLEAEENIASLNLELAEVKEDKRKYAAKNDASSVQDCIRRESNLKFKIGSQWNRCSLLESDLSKLKMQRDDLASQIKLKRDRLKRENEIRLRMDDVLENYEKTQNLRQAALDSNVSYNQAVQWLEWGKAGFNDACSYFSRRIGEIDDDFKALESKNLKSQMDSVIRAFEKTDSLEEASKLAGVSYDTVMYWYEWGSRGFGEENTYFFKKIDGVM